MLKHFEHRPYIRLHACTGIIKYRNYNPFFFTRDYGFSGANEDVILHSVELLGKDLVSWNPESRVVKPVHSLAGLLQLSYYSNQVCTDLFTA